MRKLLTSEKSLGGNKNNRHNNNYNNSKSNACNTCWRFCVTLEVNFWHAAFSVRQPTSCQHRHAKWREQLFVEEAAGNLLKVVCIVAWRQSVKFSSVKWRTTKESPQKKLKFNYQINQIATPKICTLHLNAPIPYFYISCLWFCNTFNSSRLCVEADEFV